MPDDNSTAGNSAATPPADGNAKEISRLSTELTKAQKELADAQAKIKEFEGSVGGLTTANKQANEQLATLKAQLADAVKQAETLGGEVTNWKTQHEQLSQQLGQVQSDFGKTKQELDLYQLVASKPEYHGLVGMVNSIKITNDPQQQEAILQALANGIKTQTTQTVEMFRAGGQLPGGTGGQQPGPTGPKDVKEAHARLQQIAGLPQHRAEAQQLMAFIVNPNTEGGSA